QISIKRIYTPFEVRNLSYYTNSSVNFENQQVNNEIDLPPKTFDYERLVKNSGNIDEIIYEMVNLFVHYWAEYFNDVKENCNLGRIEKLKKSAHKLKGTALQAGAMKLGGILKNLEILETDEIDGNIFELIKQAESEFINYKNELANYQQFKTILN
ncbi:MAG: Hpt domain-containing protein, partial [Candidatus Wallbacteria bacterium]